MKLLAVFNSRSARHWLVVFLAVGIGACGGSASSVNEAPPGEVPPAGTAAGTSGDVPGNGGADGGKDAAIEGGGPDAAGDSGGGPGVSCGGVNCAEPAWCLVCSPSDPGTSRSCETNPATECRPRGDAPPLQMSCDGQEDCLANERCALYEGSVGTYTRCVERTAMFGSQVCRSLADCSPDAKTCEPYVSPTYAVRVCR